MEEAKLRALSMNALTNASIPLPEALRREFCFLQLRMLCELIALGCLVAHGDIDDVKSANFQKAYNAGDIIKRLEKLHPQFYPSPRIPVFSPGKVHLADYDREFLTKDQLISLYGKCGDTLHRRSLRQLFDPNGDPPPAFVTYNLTAKRF